jgi:putative acetyltransferase
MTGASRAAGASGDRIRVIDADGGEDIAAAKALFLAYAATLDFSLCFQGFDEELAGLPGAYARPQGRLLLAKEGAAVAGVVALRSLAPEAGETSEICEMKRLYVDPAFRGRKIGEALVDCVIAEARLAGYRLMRLDTLPDRMAAAVALYRARGFRPIAAYYDRPVPGTVVFELALR